jgi:hypothetical protein
VVDGSDDHRKQTALVCTAKEASIFDLLKENLRAKINGPIITKHTALPP